MNIQNKQAIDEAIVKSQALLDLYNSKAYQTYLKPYLQSLVDVQWLDPSKFDSNEKFMQDYQYRRAKADVCSEIMRFLENQQAMMNNYIKMKAQYDETTTITR